MRAPMTIEDLRRRAADDTIDTVVVAMPDIHGRLVGKRLDVKHFLDDVLGPGVNACSYLITRDIDMEIVDGFEIAGWDSGLGDFTLMPDLGTLRPVPWMPGTAMVIADARWEDARPVVQSPREILRQQLARLAERGWTALVATELEFLLFDDDYRLAHEKHYHDLRRSTYYNIDYTISGTSSAEPLMRQIRRGMRDAGMEVEALKGECNVGQFELGFKYSDALTTCDNHVIYKDGAKEIATANDVSLTFMAKFDDGPGNSCHVHLSLIDEAGEPVFAGRDGTGFSKTFEQFLAGQLATAREFGVAVAPNINSYKRFRDGSFAPTALSWGRDNRTCAVRVLGESRSLRLENRTPGADVNPYLAVAAIIAGGLHGIEQKLELKSAETGNAYESSAERMPTSLAEAAALWQNSEIAAKAFGADVVHHYANAAFQQVAAHESAVTDWDRARGFERS
ncbi:glutamine synthetase family protein [Mycolicibacterium komossense]|uniref:Glutamine synthetase n=1 Tax=Mycolicibacterium komossense TaxID=1779 RepID=A0ABT3CI02_9MYCO|nr:glutamine synthetase family protein [Mycolicibacterium komossense]MCV7229067.1 glutamine synthetase [Mycolicibacterium komossense]